MGTTAHAGGRSGGAKNALGSFNGQARMDATAKATMGQTHSFFSPFSRIRKVQIQENAADNFPVAEEEIVKVPS